MCRDQQSEVEGLRRLHDAELFARDRPGYGSRRIDRFDRVGDRDGGDRGAGRGRRRDRARHQSRGGERTSGIVDKHEVRPPRAERLEAGADRSLPRRPAKDRRQQIKPGRRRRKKRRIVPVDDGLHHGNAAMLNEQGKKKESSRTKQFQLAQRSMIFVIKRARFSR